NALFHDSIACPASSAEADRNTPITCFGCDGFVDINFAVVTTAFQPIHNGYSLPSSPATFFSAASIAVRFSAREKSTNGSFVNSLTCTLASAVAITSLLVAGQTSH